MRVLWCSAPTLTPPPEYRGRGEERGFVCISDRPRRIPGLFAMADFANYQAAASFLFLISFAKATNAMPRIPIRMGVGSGTPLRGVDVS